MAKTQRERRRKVQTGRVISPGGGSSENVLNATFDEYPPQQIQKGSGFTTKVNVTNDLDGVTSFKLQMYVESSQFSGKNLAVSKNVVVSAGETRKFEFKVDGSSLDLTPGEYEISLYQNVGGEEDFILSTPVEVVESSNAGGDSSSGSGNSGGGGSGSGEGDGQESSGKGMVEKVLSYANDHPVITTGAVGSVVVLQRKKKGKSAIPKGVGKK